MLSLYRKLDDSIEIDGKQYEVNASFDNVLRLINLLNDKMPVDLKLTIGMQMLFGRDTELLELDPEYQKELIEYVAEEYIQSKDEIEYDDLGNVMPQVPKKRIIDIDLDAEYIYGSFIQAYGIDLIEVQGKLHWYEFRALLASLPDNTRMREIMGYRAYKKPSKSDTHHSQMMKLQEQYALPGTEEEDEEVDDFG